MMPAHFDTADFLVCLDPGHPSDAAEGATVGKLVERRINFDVAMRLARKLDARSVRYVLTKHQEHERVTNRRRAEIANNAGANLFLRLHCDAGKGRGYTWYYPDRAATKNGVTGPPPQVQTASRAAAQILNQAMASLLRPYLRSNPIRTDAATGIGSKQGGVLTGSIFARVPTTLIEMAFLNQPDDARFIGSSGGQEKMAEALAEAIEAYRTVIRGDL